MSRKQKKLINAVITLILILVTTYIAKTVPKEQAAPMQAGFYNVAQFDDGDTVVVDMNGTNETVRFIGVDTPETHDPRKAVQCYGKEASDFTKAFIGSNPVRLEADPTNTNRDRYNRLLRYIYLPDGTLVNAELIRRGYGFAYLSFPVQKADQFRALQNEAKTAGRGVWTACKPAPNKYGGFTSNDVQ